MKLHEQDECSTLFDNRVDDQSCSHEWLSSSEAASILRVTPNALRIMVYRGHVRAFKIGNRLRFRKSDCLALFKQKGA